MGLGTDLAGAYCAVSGFIIGHISAPYIEKQSKKLNVIILGLVMALLAMALSNFLRSVLGIFLGEPVRELSYYLGSALIGAWAGIMLFGLPLIVYSFINYLIWLNSTKERN